MYARNHRRAAVVSLLFLGFTLFPVTTVAAQTVAVTDIQTTVCGADSQPLITIDTPQSDTTVASTSIVLEGSVQRTSHIAVTVDGVYDQTVSLAANSERYQVDVNVAAGTRTIRLEAIGLCGESVSAGVIVSVVPDESQNLPNIIETLDSNTSVSQLDTQSESESFQPIWRMDLGAATGTIASALATTVRQLAAPLLFITSIATLAYTTAASITVQQTSTSLTVRRRKIMLIIGIIGTCLALFLGS